MAVHYGAPKLGFGSFFARRCCLDLEDGSFLGHGLYEKSSLITQMPCMWHICPRLNFKANGM